MPFYPIDILPHHDAAQAQKLRARWETHEGRTLHEKIIGLIRKGGGEDFLQREFEQGRLSFLKDHWDLAGIKLSNEDIVFPTGDNFEAIDFSYAEFWHCVFTNARFTQTGFRFARFYNVEFRNCLFAFTYFHGATLENCKFIKCDFVDYNGFTNCGMKATKFEDCFFTENLFVDCKFDENVSFDTSNPCELAGMLPKTASGFKDTLKKEMVTGIYRGIKEGFLAGQVHNKAREYLFLQQCAYTRHNRTRPLDKAGAYVWEISTGYGLRPIRVLLFLIVLFVAVCSWFSYRLGSISESLVFSAGAFLTFGARTELLQGLSFLDRIIYIAAAFAGIALVAVFITVMTNVHLKNN